MISDIIPLVVWLFQSRAGFSECLDNRDRLGIGENPRFNPVLGFLSVSTSVVVVDRRQ